MTGCATQNYDILLTPKENGCSCCTAEKLSGSTYVIHITKPCKLTLNVEPDSPSDCDSNKSPQDSGQSQKPHKENHKETKADPEDGKYG